MGNKTVLDWLREMQSQTQSPKPAQQCRRTPLPPFWELPRWLGAVSGCLEKIGGADYIVVQGESKGLKLRYRVLKDVIPLIQNKVRRRGADRNSCMPQYFVDALLELAAKFEIELKGCGAVVDGIEVTTYECRSRTPEGCVRGIAEFVKREKPRVEKARKIENIYGQLLQLLRGECPRTAIYVSFPRQLRDLWGFNYLLISG